MISAKIAAMVEREQWMEVYRGVSTKLKERSPEILQYAEDLYSKIQTQDGQVKYINGLFIMTCLTDDRFYRYLNVATLVAAMKGGMDVGVLQNAGFNPAEIVNAGSISIAKATEKAIAEKERDKRIGLMHGHYRMFTPGSMLNVVLAGEQCDSLFLGVESNWRTRSYKGVEPPYNNRMKENIMILFPRLADHVVGIKRLAYSNEGYRRLVRKVSPDIYFGNESNPQEVRDEMKTRAELAGAEYRELEYIPSVSTTEYLGLGGRAELDFSPIIGAYNQ